MDELLEHLVGEWDLRGRMGDRALFQKARGRWVLQGLFLELRFHAVRVGEDGNPAYEAIYLIGLDEKAGRYVLNLFDTFGVSSRPTPGVRAREGSTIRFDFAYDTGPFVNVFTWHPERRAWTMLLGSYKDGRLEPFAEKEMVPVTDS